MASHLFFILCLLSVLSSESSQRTTSPAIIPRVLIFSATAGFRHDSIPTAIASLRANEALINVHFDATEDKSMFNDSSLSGFDVVMFLSTTGEVLDDAGKQAFHNYLQLGGNFVGVHSASDTLVNTTFYGRELGAYFDYHPQLQNATVEVIGPSHPSTSKLPAAWGVQDEMYNFKSDPRALGAVVILAANESSYVDNGLKYNQGTPHPIAWYQTSSTAVDGSVVGRSFYTGLGHLNETWKDHLFLSHVLGGVSWVLQGNTTRAMNSSAAVGNSGPGSQGSSVATTEAGAGSAAASSSLSVRVPSWNVMVVAMIVGFLGFGWV